MLTARQAKAIDTKVRKEVGISTLVLMENAGKAITEEAIKIIYNKNKPKVAIFCGKGNNGGDGFVAARHFLIRGIKPDIFLAGKVSQVRDEARLNLEILLKIKQKIIEAKKEDLHLVKSKVAKCDLIIDALLGVGLSGRVRGIYQDLIGIINLSKAYILSVDIPSGLDATTGKALGYCIKADKTVTFMAKKRGMVTGGGSKYCGRILVKDLGIPL